MLDPFQQALSITDHRHAGPRHRILHLSWHILSLSALWHELSLMAASYILQVGCQDKRQSGD